MSGVDAEGPSSLLDHHLLPHAGAAHWDEFGLQAVVVVVPRLPDSPEDQHLMHDGPGLEVGVLQAIQAQAAVQQTAGLRQSVGEHGVVPGDAADRDGDKTL